MRFLPRFRPDTKEEKEEVIELTSSMKRAEKVTHAQVYLTNLISQGRYDEYVQYATGVYPADIAADRPINRVQR